MSDIDWSKAPEGAEFYALGSFFKRSDHRTMHYANNAEEWLQSGYSVAAIKALEDYQPRPQQWPETDERISAIAQNGNDGLHYNAPERATNDLINKPKHYQLIGDLEAIDVIQRVLTPEQFEGYLIGNFLKYRMRAGKKDDLAQDIAKSEWYRERANNIKSSDQLK